jgi:2,4-dienoyl-CoA reductase-like NADH-dependent reductase (Old Yellow Enzyme family)
VPLNTEKLFEPFVLNGLRLPNRIVMAPMTRNFSPGGVPGENVAAYYGRRAEGGVGLIITEGTIIGHPAAGHKPETPQIYGEAAIAGWSRVVQEVRAAGGRIMVQLWHLGANRNTAFFPGVVAPPMSPSGFRKPGEKVGEPMTEADIDGVIGAFAQGAATAQSIGFHGVELHGAHGYIIDQFFWSGTNYRSDKYGGSLVARARFASEIIQECRRRTGSDFPIVLRFSQWKGQDYNARNVATPEELAAFLEPLAAAGVDAFHCSQRRFWEPEFPGSDLNLAGWTKKLSGKPTITVGAVSLTSDFLPVQASPETVAGPPGGEPGRAAGMGRLLEMLNRGDFDLVAVGRGLLADPAWANKVRGGRFDELVPFSQEAREKLL